MHIKSDDATFGWGLYQTSMFKTTTLLNRDGMLLTHSYWNQKKFHIWILHHISVNHLAMVKMLYLGLVSSSLNNISESVFRFWEILIVIKVFKDIFLFFHYLIGFSHLRPSTSTYFNVWEARTDEQCEKCDATSNSNIQNWAKRHVCSRSSYWAVITGFSIKTFPLDSSCSWGRRGSWSPRGHIPSHLPHQLALIPGILEVIWPAVWWATSPQRTLLQTPWLRYHRNPKQ